MAEYRRFISYKYLYENGRKTINSGFVRVESRNGQCRLSIHMSGIYHSEAKKYQIYMLIRVSGDYIGIAIGDLLVQKQTGDMELTMDSDHLMGTTYDLDRVAGMVLLGEDGSVYGTRWDDEPLETEKFVNREPLSEILVRFGEKNSDAVADETDTERTFADAEPESVITQGTEPEAENLVSPHANENPLIPEEEVAAFVDDARMEAFEKNENPENNEILAVSKEPEMSKEQAEEQAEQELYSRSNVYDLLMSQLPQMYPFDDDSVAACVRMELQDIGRMPMPCWIYGSNSFLLHGYYCYRHLILAKVEQKKDKEDVGGRGENDGASEDEGVYLMGVPGIWQHREQYMAAMFGFRKFKPVSRENQGSGAFGYWCVELKL